MVRAIYLFVGFMVLMASCTQRMVCPAYQSAFIYDKDELRKKFSYFVGDSTPKVYTASKNKYLIAEHTSYQKKVRSLQSVPMKKVMVVVPDSISGNKEDSVITAELDAAARSIIDSTFIPDLPEPDTLATEDGDDSTYVISKDREVRVLKYNMPDSLEYDSINQKYVRQKPAYYIEEIGFNTEQDNYMWYLRRNLVLPDVRLAKTQGKTGGDASAVKKKKGKKGFFGFFKGLFKKEKTADIDSAELDVNTDENEFDFIDTTAQEEPVRRSDLPKEKKKGLFSRDKADEENQEDVTEETPVQTEKPKKKKKKKKSDDKAPVEKPEEEKKPEDDDDGF
jgi:hypothetical protein